MPEWLSLLLYFGLIAATFALLHWYIEVYSPRKDWEEAVRETDAQFDHEYGPGWRERAKRGQIPPRQSPPAPVPPMADLTYGCAEHYYGGKCPTCGQPDRRP